MHWPKGVKGKGEIRTQFYHVIDVAKTILDVAGLPEPAIVNSIAQAPFEGVSMKASFTDAKTPETHLVQYFEMFGNRGIYHEGGRPSPSTGRRGRPISRRPSMRTSGSSTARTTGRSPGTSHTRIRRNSRSCSGCG